MVGQIVKDRRLCPLPRVADWWRDNRIVAASVAVIVFAFAWPAMAQTDAVSSDIFRYGSMPFGKTIDEIAPMLGAELREVDYPRLELGDFAGVSGLLGDGVYVKGDGWRVLRPLVAKSYHVWRAGYPRIWVWAYRPKAAESTRLFVVYKELDWISGSRRDVFDAMKSEVDKLTGMLGKTLETQYHPQSWGSTKSDLDSEAYVGHWDLPGEKVFLCVYDAPLSAGKKVARSLVYVSKDEWSHYLAACSKADASESREADAKKERLKEEVKREAATDF